VPKLSRIVLSALSALAIGAICGVFSDLYNYWCLKVATYLTAVGENLPRLVLTVGLFRILALWRYFPTLPILLSLIYKAMPDVLTPFCRSIFLLSILLGLSYYYLKVSRHCIEGLRLWVVFLSPLSVLVAVFAWTDAIPLAFSLVGLALLLDMALRDCYSRVRIFLIGCVTGLAVLFKTTSILEALYILPLAVLYAYRKDRRGIALPVLGATVPFLLYLSSPSLAVWSFRLVFYNAVQGLAYSLPTLGIGKACLYITALLYLLSMFFLVYTFVKSRSILHSFTMYTLSCALAVTVLWGVVTAVGTIPPVWVGKHLLFFLEVLITFVGLRELRWISYLSMLGTALEMFTWHGYFPDSSFPRGFLYYLYTLLHIADHQQLFRGAILGLDMCIALTLTCTALTISTIVLTVSRCLKAVKER